MGYPVIMMGDGVMVVPKSNMSQSKKKVKVKKIIRPLPESLIPVFQAKLSSQNFLALDGLPVNKMVELLHSIIDPILSDTFPEKQIIISPFDDPWFTEQLRKLKRQRQRHYERHGKDDKYIELKTIFDEKFKNERAKYKQKIEKQVQEGSRGSIYPILKRMGSRLFEQSQSDYQILNHVQLGLSPAQSAEKIADYFSMISQEFAALDISLLPAQVRTYLRNYNPDVAPRLTVSAIYSRIKKARKPNGLVPGDLPKKLLQHCANIISVPAAYIFNQITITAVFPTQWKVEHQLAIPKNFPPENEDDLRNLAKTPFLSKVYESFVGGWLLDIIKPYLDPDQCGMKGLSITHYLVKLLDFVHSTLDNKKPHSVLAACVDISKAFNRVDHSLVIQDLYDMHTPAWLLNIVVSYLSDRSMVLTFNNCESSRKLLPGGGPQGAYMGGLIFMIKYNGAFLRPPIPRPIKGPVSKSKAKKVKFVDDGTVAVSLDLQQCLVSDSEQRAKPVTYHERTQHILPPQNNLLHYYIKDTEHFASENKMVINKSKTKVISFNKARKWDFPPEMKFLDGTPIEHVSQTKLVGVIISETLSWQANTQYICNKARKKLWLLRRMVKLDLDTYLLFDAYIKEVRSILELAVPVWHSSLTRKQSLDIERVQKVAFRIILGPLYISYKQACQYLCTKTLEERRTKLCLKFAKKNLKSENCMFVKNTQSIITRQPTKIVKEYKCRTGRYYKSSIPYLARLLNTDQLRR